MTRSCRRHRSEATCTSSTRDAARRRGDPPGEGVEVVAREGTVADPGRVLQAELVEVAIPTPQSWA